LGQKTSGVLRKQRAPRHNRGRERTWKNVTGDGPTTLHIFVEGRVHGVGYREFARRAGSRLHLSGWARNRSNGTVEVRASGAPRDLDALVEALRAGPPLADVRGLQAVEDGGPPECGGFVIHPTV
jgi:acylphosphatase